MFKIEETPQYKIIVIFGIKITFKKKPEKSYIDKIVWWIPIKSLRNAIREYFISVNNAILIIKEQNKKIINLNLNIEKDKKEIITKIQELNKKMDYLNSIREKDKIEIIKKIDYLNSIREKDKIEIIKKMDYLNSIREKDKIEIIKKMDYLNSIREKDKIEIIEKIDYLNSIREKDKKDILSKITQLRNDNIRSIDIISDIILHKDKEKIFFIGTPEHTNIGDHAIAYATNIMLKKLYKDKLIKEYTSNDFIYAKNVICKFIKDSDIIFLSGGGNLGNLWILEENVRRDIISKFKNNELIILPQSIYFSNDENGIEELKKSKRIYNSHNNLTIMARDKKSYDFAKEYFCNNKIILSPDIVFSLCHNINIPIVNREGILFLLRTDKEKITDDQLIENIKLYLSSINENYVIETNLLTSAVPNCKLERENIVINQLNNISKYKICITDRLHGAILSYITNTPCIVFKSLDHKIEYGLEWLKDVKSITYIDENKDIEYIKSIINKYLNNENINLNTNIDFDKQIEDLILNIIGK